MPKRFLLRSGSFSKLLLVALVALLSVPARAADRPLTRDDVTLLLIGGATSEKMVSLVEQRGVDFEMNSALEEQYRRDGANDAVIAALKKASSHRGSGQGATPAPAASSAPPEAPQPPPLIVREANAKPAQPAPAHPAASQPQPSKVQDKIASTLSELDNRPGSPSAATGSAAPAPAKAAAEPAPPLTDPSPDEIQKIIQTFAAKETLFKQARDNYTYHQINKVETLDADNQPTGFFEQDWDILYDQNGSRIERVTYAPQDTLKSILITEQDIDAFRNIQPFVLTSDELPEYEIKYLGHVKVDELTTYVFSVRPREIKKGRQYFQGVVWVDDRDLQIVKSEGKNVPELRGKKGQNLFPRFTTYREQIDGKFWFPTFTLADDTLYFDSGPVHIREVVKYTDYKQFRSSVKTKMISEVPDSQQKNTQTKQPPKK